MRIPRVVAEVVAWWVVAFSVWMITLSIAPLQEYLLAVGCGLICALAAVWARRALEASWVLRPSWVLPLLAVPLIVVTDTVQVLLAPLRPARRRGRFTTVGTRAVDDLPAARSRRAVATWLMSVTPGSYVLDADPDTGDLTVHSLAWRGPRMEKLVEKLVGE
jgi:multisubunit Na+/H+ antiporter MnhE subunit